ncbi:hypothetical protein SAMN05216174_106224 [Actinokineospora iranica]|uniref:Uncharacterized protein n=1 Tax=Actinokineospora iranica TaxID=1271860 RepID=A0A1G6R952_9PSEU|nr:hypothetical protein SAMN05216174_106224 [Actinokineospora iranica]
MEAISRIVGKIVDIGVSDLKDVNLHLTQGGANQRACGPLLLAPAATRS